MAYRVKMTDYAIGQMENAAAYIAHDLHEPEAADRWLSRMQKEIMTLGFMPGRIPLYSNARSFGVLRMLLRRSGGRLFCVQPCESFANFQTI